MNIKFHKSAPKFPVFMGFFLNPLSPFFLSPLDTKYPSLETKLCAS